MIITVGGTPAPLIKTINEHRPEVVCFLASQDTNDKITEIKKGIINRTKSEVVLLDDVNDLLHCYRKSIEAAERVTRKGFFRNSVIVDYTGGTKNMSAALVLATVAYGFIFSYVGGARRDKEGVGIVINGQEKVYAGVNPWDFLAVEEKRKISVLFNSCQYQGAKDLIESLLEKISPLEKPLFEILLDIVNGFYKWDMFQHEKAHNCFEKAKLDTLVGFARAKDDSRLLDFAHKVKQAHGNLKKIISLSKKSKTVCKPLIEDLFANAERRYKEGKIDDAILRLYRIVEMAAQERLSTKFDLDTSNIDLEKVPAGYRAKLVINNKDRKENKIKTGLLASYTLLDKLNDSLGKSYFDKQKQFLSIQSARNFSYLAHGIQSSKSDTYISLKKFLVNIVEGIEHGTSFPEMDI